MDQLNRSNRHRAEVIEVYDNGSCAAVKFASGRVECVKHNGTAGNPDTPQTPFRIGQRGMVDYVRSLQGYHWTFVPNKTKEKTE